MRRTRVIRKPMSRSDRGYFPADVQPQSVTHPLVRLQQAAGNQGVQFALSRQAIGQARTDSQPLSGPIRAQMQQALGADLSRVRVHTGGPAHRLNQSFGARALTVNQDIFFRHGEYQPGTASGQRLLAHELAHAVQQQAASTSGPVRIGQPGDHYEREAGQVASRLASRGAESVAGLPAVPVQQQAPQAIAQRDLTAYNKEKTEFLPSMGEYSSTTFITTSAEAAGIRSALAKLITDGKVTEIVSTSGNLSWFSANHHKNAQLADIEKAFKDEGYTDATRLAKALYDIHGEYLYSNDKITTVAAFTDFTTETGRKARRQGNRSMTEYEIRQARRVFKSAINYSKVTIADGSIGGRVVSVGGYARTVGNTIYFPTDSTRSMAFMIHELTHVWQYQTTGWTYAPKALWAQIVEGYSYTPSGKTPDQALKDARAAGQTLYDFNKEQQGDILADYFRRLQGKQDVTAYEPFVNDIK